VIVGFLIYHFTLGKIILTLSECIAFVLKAIFMVFLGLIFKPISFFGHFLTKKIKKIEFIFNMTIANIQKKLYNNYIRKKLIKKSKKAFLNIGR
jgi:hypothetical protein